MSRADILLPSIKKRLSDTAGHVETLTIAAARFGDDFDPDAFAAAWNGSDQQERIAAYAVQAGYENSINGAIKIAQELCELEGWTPPNQEPSSVEALKRLQENGVVTSRTRTQLKNAYEGRSDLQHDYVNTFAAEMHDATRATLEAVPLLLQDVTQYIAQRYR